MTIVGFDLNDEECAVIEPLLPPKRARSGAPGPPDDPERNLLNPSNWRTLAGLARTLWPSYDGLQSLCPLGWTRHLAWDIRGPGDRMRGRFGLYRQFHRQGAPCGEWRKRGQLRQGIGRSRGGRSSKVHAAVDALGRSLRIGVTGDQTHDNTAFESFQNWQEPPLAIVADKAYGGSEIRQSIADVGAVAVIPSKSNARRTVPYDPDLYAMRNLVERFFCRMKDMPRLTTRYEKLKRSFLSMLHIFAISCWLS